MLALFGVLVALVGGWQVIALLSTENNFDDYTLSSPAISEGQIFIRTTSGLWAIGKRVAN